MMMVGCECVASTTFSLQCSHLSSPISPFSNRISALSAASVSPFSYTNCSTTHRLELSESISSGCCLRTRRRLGPLSALPQSGSSEFTVCDTDNDRPPSPRISPYSVSRLEGQEDEGGRVGGASFGGGSSAILSSCLVGLLTGIGVVLFNNAVHEIRDFFWDGIPYRGASWLREEPVQDSWKRVILVPVCGGCLVSILNLLRGSTALRLDNQYDSSPLTEVGSPAQIGTRNSFSNQVKAAIKPFLKAVAACVTLGTGNSLGPEGPSVEIGASIAKGVSRLTKGNTQGKLSLLAAGSAAGISSGFNAAVAGCFFAVESVLWPSPADSSLSLTNTTSMVILSAVIASVVSEIGLGSEPAFKVPEYDFRSPSELPLYLLLGVLCGLVSLAFSQFTSYMLAYFDNLHKKYGIPKAVFPVIGGVTIGLIALEYPEILYWGFQNVDILLESRPFVKGLSAILLVQLVAVKILATSLCRASGLVGGYYAPSLFIGAATGMAYGKFVGLAVAGSNPVFQLSFLDVASPQAYGLVGMAATLAGVCQVPLTSVLLLFELTQDYRIVLPLLGAVGVSSWITSGQTKRGDGKEIEKQKLENIFINQQSERPTEISTSSATSEKATYASDLCEVESSLCTDDSYIEIVDLEKRISVAEAMKTRYVTVLLSTLVTDALSLMLSTKESCAVVVDEKKNLIGFLTLEGIQEFCTYASTSKRAKDILVSEMCSSDDKICQLPWTATPSMDLYTAQMNMKKVGVSLVPVVEEKNKDCRNNPVGILDSECISLTCSLRGSIVFQEMDGIVETKGKVCVTGASGFLASWLVKRLLLAGYHVVGTVRDPGNEKKLAHLWKLEGADERLQLVKADLMKDGSFDDAIMACQGVFHTASPVLKPSSDPEVEILKPAIDGTLNVLRSCKKNPFLKRVVLTSSSSTVRARDDFDPKIPLDESSWSSIELCKRLQVWYIVSKTLAEKAAWNFCNENGIDLVTVLPSFVVGPSLPPDLCSTASDIVGLLKGETEKFQWHGRMGYVHIDDVALCHILLYEHENARGRYLCSSTVLDNTDLATMLSIRYPSLPIKRRFEPLNRPYYELNTSKIQNLGFKFKSIEEMFDDCVESLLKQGHLSLV